MSSQIQQQLASHFADRSIAVNKNISLYLTLRTPVTAEYYREADTEADLLNAVKATQALSIPLTLIGGGSNLAVTKVLIPGLTLRNLYQKKAVIKEAAGSVEVVITSGYVINRLVRETTDAGYSGFEYHLGLPGTLGGAVCMNSKWTHGQVSYIGDNLVSARLITPNGSLKTVTREYFKFAYDYSILQDTKELLLDATFRLTKADPETLKQRAQAALAYRKQTQPMGVATCGCFFRNISEAEQQQAQLPTKSAGYLIDNAGCKNMQVGDYKVSPVHANFIINTGTGNPEDLKHLLTQIKAKVFKLYHIKLVEEVVII